MDSEPTTTTRDDVAERYRRWADVEAHGMSPGYERLAHAVAERGDVLDLLLTVETAQRQPNLLFGALRWHGAPVLDPSAALDWAVEHPADVLEVLTTRRTQTNEAARCALLLPALAQLAGAGEIALVEIGASAGLCLLPDRWRYRYHRDDGSEHLVGATDSPVVIDCDVTGDPPLPDEVPTIAWRAGLDLDPVDVTDPAARRWLECLIWPEHTERAERLTLALEVAASDPAPVRRGDAVVDLAALLDEVPAGMATVVTHTAALVYLPDDARRSVVELLRDRGVHRLGAEGPSVLPGLAPEPPRREAAEFWVALDDRVLASAQPHGRWLAWL